MRAAYICGLWREPREGKGIAEVRAWWEWNKDGAVVRAHTRLNFVNYTSSPTGCGRPVWPAMHISFRPLHLIVSPRPPAPAPARADPRWPAASPRRSFGHTYSSSLCSALPICARTNDRESCSQGKKGGPIPVGTMSGACRRMWSTNPHRMTERVCGRVRLEATARSMTPGMRPQTDRSMPSLVVGRLPLGVSTVQQPRPRGVDPSSNIVVRRHGSRDARSQVSRGRCVATRGHRHPPGPSNYIA